jgi:hypothetical protein
MMPEAVRPGRRAAGGFRPQGVPVGCSAGFPAGCSGECAGGGVQAGSLSASTTGRADVGSLEGGGGMDPASGLGFSSVTENFTTSVHLGRGWRPGVVARFREHTTKLYRRSAGRRMREGPRPLFRKRHAVHRRRAGKQLAPKACNLGVRQIDQTFRGLTDRQR